MKPVKGSSVIQIPITFDGKGGRPASRQAKILWTSLLLGLWLFSSVLVFLADHSWFRWVYPFLSLFLLSYVIRFLVLRESYFKARRKELQENNYLFDHTLFWNIYEIGNRPPHIVKFGNGLRGVFIALDKDVIIGRDPDHDYYHHEAIAEAYKQMEKRNIECIHIDYMDTVGKDERMNALFEQVDKTENLDLRKVVTRMYDHTVSNMNHSYASYDVYCFYSSNREDLFWDELQVVLSHFKDANYIRARVLNREGISALVQSVMNINNFSINQANDSRLLQMNALSQHLRPIWVESNGQRTVLNKTTEELLEAKRVLQAEKSVRRKRKGLRKAKLPEITLSPHDEGSAETGKAHDSFDLSDSLKDGER